MQKQGWLNAGTNPKLMKGRVENKNYGVLQAKKIASALNHLFNEVEDLVDFEIFVRDKKVLNFSKFEYYSQFVTKSFSTLTRDDANKFVTFLFEYTEWEKRTGRKSTEKYFFCQNTINIVALKSFFTYSVMNGIIANNLFSNSNIPRKVKTSKPVFSNNELLTFFNDKLAEKLYPQIYNSSLYRAYKFAALTGLRSGEVRALQWNQFDSKNKTLLINRAFKLDATKRDAIGKPKWDKERKIVLCDSAIDCLGERRYDSDFVFQLKSGSAIGSNKYSREFTIYAEILDKEFIKRDRLFLKGRKFTPHCLRGTLNSLLLSTGNLNESLIQEYMGWTKTALTQVQRTHYTTFSKKGLYKVANEIEKIFSGKSLSWSYEDDKEDFSYQSTIEDIISSDEEQEGYIPSLNKPIGDFGKYDEADERYPREF